jgi:hypothetical protein
MRVIYFENPGLHDSSHDSVYDLHCILIKVLIILDVVFHMRMARRGRNMLR